MPARFLASGHILSLGKLFFCIFKTKEMTYFEIYSLIVCIIVYVLLAGLGIVVLTTIFKLTVKLIKNGVNDKEILDEYNKYKDKKKSCAFDCISSVLLCAILCTAFVFSVYVGCAKDTYFEDVPTFKVVNSSSMAKKNEKNNYLFENELNDQFTTFDLILTYDIPKEQDLKLYDIVIYEIDDIFVIHRIVGIEEPNAKHPNERWFLLQGDAISQADRFPVKYSQMVGIYRGERIPFIGSFISFMQSPVGYMCIILVALAIIFTPIFEKKIEKEKKSRLIAMGVISEEELKLTTKETQAKEEIAVAKDEKTLIEQTVKLIVSEGEKVREEPVIVDKTPIYKAHSIFAMFNSAKSFEEKFAIASDELKGYYNDIVNTLWRIEKIRAIRGFKGETYRRGNKSVLKLAIRGKTLNVFLALDPQDFIDTKYIYENVSDKSGYENYAMRVRITSLRQAKWVKELILIIADKNGFKVAKEPVTNIADLFASFKKSKTFTYKLRMASDFVKGRYKEITSYINSFEKARVIRGKKGEPYKFGNKCLCKLTIRGKTLNAYIALNPKTYENTKYIYTDVSSSKSYANYPMRVKVTSDRQVKWVKELISIVAKGDKNL